MNENKAVTIEAAKPVKSTNPWLRALTSLLTGLQHGHLTLILPDGNIQHYGSGRLQASVTLNSYKPVSALLLKGDLAFAESYLRGEWESPDLVSLFELALKNESLFSLNSKRGWLFGLVNRWRHLLNANSKRGSRRNISYHYDLGNEFYAKWLDQSMTYSSAIFREGDDLAAAQLRKYRTIAEMAQLSEGEKILEIGCGWGGFSEIAALEYGCEIQGLTLSTEQQSYARNRYHAKGIADKASVALTDYRDSVGVYDKVVSIEMFEAVGCENWNIYFETIKKRLKPGGIAVLQTILIADERFESYKNRVDFIQRHIFPGGLLPSLSTFKQALRKHNLKLEDSIRFGSSYARTCEIWQRNFQHAWDDIQKIGFDSRFKRMWEYYLSYCIAGFKAGSIDVGLFKVHKPA